MAIKSQKSPNELMTKYPNKIIEIGNNKTLTMVFSKSFIGALIIAYG
jgi:hypothetical protein